MPGHHHKRRFAWALLLLLTPALAGCFGASSTQTGTYCPPAVVASADSLHMQLDMAEALDRHRVETTRAQKAAAGAQARIDYNNRRPDAPDKYTVFPKPPRNNDFGEFVDNRFHGLDAQPTLPALPADAMLPPPGFGSGSGAGALGGIEDSGAPAVVNTSYRNYPPPASVRQPARAADASRLPQPAGPTPGAGYYPIEQLVYGGDHAELDKPELYRLMPRDVITVTVKDHPEFSGQTEIQPDGTVRLPTAPDMPRLRGLTAEEAAEHLREVLSVYINGETKVRVQANRARGGYYYVFGDVLQPGRFPMGIEAVKLSEAILAANWEANPGRRDRDLDGDELSPSFPAATPRGRFIAPRTSDLARVMLVTPHRSQPVRVTHDVRSALMGMTGDDPILRPGQIVIVPSLDRTRNRELGIEPPEGLLPGQGFSNADSPARLAEVVPPAPPVWTGPREVITVRESNMTETFHANQNVGGATIYVPPAESFDDSCAAGTIVMERPAPTRRDVGGNGKSWKMGF